MTEDRATPDRPAEAPESQGAGRSRVIKRYESRKLYDTEESRYVSLQDVAEWIRDGWEVEVVDNATSESVTSQTLAQIILDEGKSGRGRLSPELLHDLVRSSGERLSSGVHQVQRGLNKLVQASFDRLGPVKEARAEMSQLRGRLDELEAMLRGLEGDDSQPAPVVEQSDSDSPDSPTKETENDG